MTHFDWFDIRIAQRSPGARPRLLQHAGQPLGLGAQLRVGVARGLAMAIGFEQGDVALVREQRVAQRFAEARKSG